MQPRFILRALVVVSTLLPAGRVAAQHEQHGGGSGETLGTVEFATSCQPVTRQPFNRAVALLHSFEFREAIDGFDQVLAADPACAIAHWGRALAYWGNPFAPGVKGGPLLQHGRAAAEAAAAAAGRVTPRERAFIEAVGELFRSADAVPQRERILAYETRMERLAAAHPDDNEATIFYALAVSQAALPTDKTYARQLKAGQILEPLFAKHPDHPGLAHYIIHAYDHPPLAPRALEAARRYAKIAPSAPHALHMPSHTFTRVGYWQDSIDTNIASAETAMKGASYSEALHAMDYQMYAYLQTAQDAAARKVLERAPEVAARLSPDAVTGAAPATAGFYARAAIPARYALERGDWPAAAALPVQPSPTPYADAITHFARALGAARSGHASAADDVARLAALRDARFAAAARDSPRAHREDRCRGAAMAGPMARRPQQPGEGVPAAPLGRRHPGRPRGRHRRDQGSVRAPSDGRRASSLARGRFAERHPGHVRDHADRRRWRNR